jgi:NADH:ubiquinone oxidoreductase subunit 6 (subunit J)
VTIADILFYLFAALTVLPAIGCVVFSRNIVRAAFLLLLTFWGVAGLYALLSAEFLAAVQLIVYVGGILVLILFGVMLSRRMTMAELPVTGGAMILAATFCGIFLYGLSQIISKTPWDALPEPANTPTVARIGELFLGQFLLPFEFISVLLLGALVGAVILARKEFDEPGEEQEQA